MNRGTRLLLMAALIIPALFGNAFAGDHVGRVPGRVILVLAPDTFPKVETDGKSVSTGLPGLDKTADRLGAVAMDRLYRAAAAPAKSDEPDLRLHWTLDIDPAADLDAALAEFEALPEVARAYPVDIFRNDDLPDDPNLGNQWYLRNTNPGGKDIRALGGWAETHGDTSIVVAVVDSGVDWRHPDLGGTGPDYIDGNIWINWAEWNGTAGVDDDSNGYVDDFRGWDFVTGVSGWDDADTMTPDNDPMDFGGHGTNCAGCVSAITDNGVGIAGTGWDCKVMALRAGYLPRNETHGVVRMDFCSSAMVYAARNGAKIVNCSWGSSDYLDYAMNYCTSQGVLVITAAGNDNDQESDFLGDHADVVAVAATGPDDGKTDFSSYGLWVELSAPGIDIYTTAWNQTTGEHTYASVQGTSFSSPIACGAAALIWSVHPTWNRAQVRAALLSAVDDIDGANPIYAGKLGSGRVNLLKALGDNFHQVPDELPTVLDAINEAAPGDSVAVAATTVIDGPLTVIDKEIWIGGGWNADFSDRDPAGSPTLIQANAAKTAMNFQTGVGPATVVDGFRCSGGGGQSFSDIPISGKFGGGIVINRVAPTLRRIDITGNSVGGTHDYGGGGGLLLHQSDAVCEDLTIHGNSAVRGAGVYIYGGSPVLRRCVISDNTVHGDNMSYPAQGGGVYVMDAAVTFEDCSITGHLDVDQGGGVYAGIDTGDVSLTLQGTDIGGNMAKTAGGGVYQDGGSFSATAVSVTGNGKTPAATFMKGGGLAIYNADVYADSLDVSGNASHLDAGVDFNGVANLAVTHSLFTGNDAAFLGGGVHLQNVSAGSFSHNTVAGNSSVNGAAGLYVASSTVDITNNIMAFNTGGSNLANGVSIDAAPAVFSCNDVFGNDNAAYSGMDDPTGTGGNIAADPNFCPLEGAEYYLLDPSPCQETNSGGCGVIGARGVGCVPVGVGDGDVPGSGPAMFTVDPNFPNPFNPATSIRFSLPQAGRTTVRIYDLAGRLVKTLVDEDLAAETHVVQWRGRDESGRAAPSGVYFYRVESGPFLHAGRMALIR